MANLRLENVIAETEEGERLRRFSLDVADGEMVILLGRGDDVGARPLVRSIAGLEEVEEGEIYIDDVLQNQVPSKERGVAMVAEGYGVFPNADVHRNLSYYLKMQNWEKEAIEARVEESAQLIGMLHLMNRKTTVLSEGQRMRLAVAMVAVSEPAVMLMDKPPFDKGSTARAHICFGLNLVHKKYGCTTIYATDDPQEAIWLGGRVVEMESGIFQREITADQLIE